MNKYKVGSMFAGVGGICLGFLQAGTEIVWANEIDPHACTTYRENFGDSYLQEGDIQTVVKEEIPQIDILTAGFPCQPFSSAGYLQGFDDERGNLFFQIIDVIDTQKKIYKTKPKAIMLENVKHLVSQAQRGRSFRIIKEALESRGYKLKVKILNSMKYGNVPHNRERVYIVGFLDPEQTKRFDFPQPIPLTNKLNDVIDRSISINDPEFRKYYYDETSPYYQLLKETITSYETVYQLRRNYVRANKHGVCPTLTANMGVGGHNVPLILDNEGNIRKLTPRECFLLQAFPKDFKLPKIANIHLYKQAGNTVTVSVVKRIAENIIAILDNKN